MKYILFLSPCFKKRIWGGDYFQKVMNKTDSKEPIGEMWSASGHPKGDSLISNGRFQGKTLREIYENNPEFFNYPKSKVFPILIKLIATADDLSIQVHPNDDYAIKNENGLGKTEAWIIIEAKEDAEIIYGHNAKSKEELINLIGNNKYDEFLNRVKVNKGDFYPIPAGTIHALGKGIILLEVQQSSDITYRIYDYNRKDKDGNTRELHIDKAIDVTTYDKTNNFKPLNYLQSEKDEIELWDNNYFKINLLKVNSKYKLPSFEYYGIISVIEGKFIIEGRTLSIGDSFVAPNLAEDLFLTGDGRIVITIPKES
jgi:mannose-6-phosphate isomerase